MTEEENHNFVPDDLSNYKVARAGDLVINKMKAWQGSLGLAPTDGIVSPAYFVFQFGMANRMFGQMLLRSRPYIDFFARLSDGVRIGQWDLSPEAMKWIPVVVPSVSDQDAIVRFLDHADQRIRRYIRAKQKVINLLDEERQAVINRAVTHGFDPGVRLKSSGIKGVLDIPEHWQLRRLQYASGGVTVGVVVNPSSYFDENGTVPMLLGNNVLPGRFRLDRVMRISAASNERLGKSQLHTGDLVVVRVGAPGVAAVVPETLDGANCASVLIVRKGPYCHPHWLEMVFNSPVVRAQVDMVKYGAAQKQFNVSHAVEFLIPVPPLTEQAKILRTLYRRLETIDPAMDAAGRSIKLLRAYRTRLIADVVTGKWDVRAAAASLQDEGAESDNLLLADEEFGEAGENALTPDELAAEEGIA